MVSRKGKNLTAKETVTPEEEPLTELEDRFVHYYLLNPSSAGQAWIKAGGKPGDHARKTAHQAMQRPRVKKAIDDGRKEIAARFKVTEDRVIQELSYLAFSDPRDVFDENGALLRPDEWSSEAAAAISSLEVVVTAGGKVEDDDGEVQTVVERVAKIKRWDKGQALEKLCKHLGLFAPEKHEVTGKNGGPIEVSSKEYSDEQLDQRIKELTAKVAEQESKENG